MEEENLSANDIVLVRCIITSKGKVCFKGKDYQENKYLIARNSGSKGFKVGEDRSFYAYKRGSRGFFVGRVILHPLTEEQYNYIIPHNGTAGKTLKEIGLGLKDL